ncbi:MAG: YraN family protein [Pseudomonadota bacterium]
MANNRRQSAEKRGRRAESLAAIWLQIKGYRILARRFKTPVGEIDLIVQRGAVIAFVEVKARGNKTDALQALNAQSRARITRAADWYLARRHATRMAPKPHKKAEITRFDMVLVVPGRPPHHMPNAWVDGLA